MVGAGAACLLCERPCTLVFKDGVALFRTTTDCPFSTRQKCSLSRAPCALKIHNREKRVMGTTSVDYTLGPFSDEKDILLDSTTGRIKPQIPIQQ